MAVHAAWCAAVLTLACVVQTVHAHGRLIEPPSRGSMWRYGFDTPPDYNDHETNCGGFGRQWTKNGGRCGACGDPFDSPEPRPHEMGGAYGLGVIARRYRAGAQIVIRVELTANHLGHFEFRLCANDVPKTRITQACLDEHLLMRTRPNGGETRFYPGDRSGVLEARYQLPPGLRCDHCVLQWRYIAGNSWGKCANGTELVGCGSQEEFRACSDVAILGPKGEVDDEPQDAEAPPPGGVVWLVALAALGAVLAAFLGLYLYYYHLRGRLKAWLLARRLRQPVNHG